MPKKSRTQLVWAERTLRPDAKAPLSQSAVIAATALIAAAVGSAVTFAMLPHRRYAPGVSHAHHIAVETSLTSTQPAAVTATAPALPTVNPSASIRESAGTADPAYVLSGPSDRTTAPVRPAEERVGADGAFPPPGLAIGRTPGLTAINLGNWSYDHHDWASAIAYYNEAIRRRVDNAEVRTDLGNAYRFHGDLTISLAEYARAQRMNPRHESSLFNQGMVYILLGKPQQALAIWRTYLRRFPHGAHAEDVEQLIAQFPSSTNGH